jgi:AraC family transcriptional activator of pobA
MKTMTLTRSHRRIPSFSLYGERSPDAGHTDPLHVEDIQSRSRKYLWQIGAHRHTGFCQIVYVTTGPVVVDLEETHKELEGPVAIVIPSGSVHGFRFRSESQGYVLTMDLDRLLGFAGAAHHSPIAALFSAPRTVRLAADHLLAARTAALFANLLQEFRQPDSLHAPVSAWLACSALWTLAATVPTRAPAATATALPGHDLSRLRRFRTLVEAHYLEHWPVERYAAELSVSESSLNRLCRMLAGSTAFEVIQQRLALEARRRLSYVADGVAVLAAELGFKDPAYFCRFFRKHHGMSPTEFRRHQQSAQAGG